MGNCCPKSSKLNESCSIELLETSKLENETVSTLDRLSGHQTTVDFEMDQSIDFLKEFTGDDIESLRQQFLNEMYILFPQLEQLKTIEQGEFFNCDIFGKMIAKEDSNGSDVVMSERLRTNHKAEFVLFAFLNQAIKLSNSVDHSEILWSQATSDTIYAVEVIKTKRVFVISPRSMMILHICKKIDDDTFVHLMQSINMTKLMQCKPIFDAYSKLSDIKAIVFVSGQIIKNRDGFCEIESFTRSDFQLTVGFTLLKPFLTREYVNTLSNYSKNCESLLSKNHEEPLKSIIWFKDGHNRANERQNNALPQFLQENIRLKFFDDPKQAKLKYESSLLQVDR